MKNLPAEKNALISFASEKETIAKGKYRRQSIEGLKKARINQLKNSGHCFKINPGSIQ